MRNQWMSLALGLACATGCAHGTENLVRSGMAGGVGGSLEALNDPHNKALLLRLQVRLKLQCLTWVWTKRLLLKFWCQ